MKRTAESKWRVYSAVRFTDSMEPAAAPSAEALGYFLSVRFADEEKDFSGKALIFAARKPRDLGAGKL